MQHGDAMRGHPRVAGQGTLVVLRRQVVSAGVHLASHSGLRPPRVRAGDELLVRVQASIENGFGDLGPPEQMLEVSFGAGPDPVADVAHRRAKQRRTLNRPGLELGSKHSGRARSQLDGRRDDGAHIGQAGHAARGIGDRPAAWHPVPTFPGGQPNAFSHWHPYDLASWPQSSTANRMKPRIHGV